MWAKGLTAIQDPGWLFLNLTVFRAHRHTADGENWVLPAGQALGRSRGVLSTNVHVPADALDDPVGVTLTGGMAAGTTQAEATLEGLEPGAVVVDKPYDSDALKEGLSRRPASPVG